MVPTLLALQRHPELWDAHTARTEGGVGPHGAVSDIWVRFRDPHELNNPAAYAQSFTPVFYPAWAALPSLRPIVFGLMARLEAVALGGVLITRVPAGQAVQPHNDRGRWHPEYYRTKVYLPLASNPRCINTCEREAKVFAAGDVFSFDNLLEHATINEGDSERITLIISLRCE